DFSSPGFMSDDPTATYPNSASCEFVIHVSEGMVIELKFVVFELERPSPSGTCKYDYVRIRDDGDLYEICDTHQFHTRRSKSNWLYIDFESDLFFSKRGFHASYIAVPEEDPECGHPIYLNISHGALHSPGYLKDSCDNMYRISENCTWEIDVGDGMEIELMFNEFELELWSGCGTDFVMLDDGHRSIKLCGDKTSYMYRSTGSWLRIAFYSDPLGGTRRGFNASY
ncbi:unnamed protein product, partial [Owenia fusiformis]